jgi:antitoxin (DNA-binding transcriptional repressor) of toxin-antitoxin stability system
MINASVKELRAKLKYYMDQLEKGEEITIVRHSRVIGRLVPNNMSNKKEQAATISVKNQETDQNTNKLSDKQRVAFRRFAQFENPDAVYRLYQLIYGISDDDLDDSLRGSDLLGPHQYYEAWGGEFWIGELADGQIVAIGGFRVALNGGTTKQAELKRLDIRPDLQSTGLSDYLREMLADRAKQHGYETLIETNLDDYDPPDG